MFTLVVVVVVVAAAVYHVFSHTQLTCGLM